MQYLVPYTQTQHQHAPKVSLFITHECENSQCGLKLERLHKNLILYVCMLGWHISGPQLNSLNSYTLDAQTKKEKHYLLITSTQKKPPDSTLFYCFTNCRTVFIMPACKNQPFKLIVLMNS